MQVFKQCQIEKYTDTIQVATGTDSLRTYLESGCVGMSLVRNHSRAQSLSCMNSPSCIGGQVPRIPSRVLNFSDAALQNSSFAHELEVRPQGNSVEHLVGARVLREDFMGQSSPPSSAMSQKGVC
jgi:hypothetical protein